MRKAPLLYSIQLRFPFRAAQRLLKSVGFPSSQTWQGIHEKIAASRRRLDYHALDDAYVESLVASEKSISGYDIGSAKRAALLGALASLTPDPDNLFVKKYPYVLDDETLAKKGSAGTTFVGRKTLSFGTAFMFATVRVAEHKEKLPLIKLPASWRTKFAEVYGVRKNFRQSYDAIILPDTGGYAWLVADCPLYTPEDFSDFAHLTVPRAFNTLAGEEVLDGALNLFPLIRKLYNQSSEGVLASLSHVTPTHSVKHEKMKNEMCLRTELFHEAGSKAVDGNLSAFAIGILWEGADEDGAGVQIEINGIAKDAGKANAYVDRAVVRNGVKLDDIKFAFEKILQYATA